VCMKTVFLMLFGFAGAGKGFEESAESPSFHAEVRNNSELHLL